MSRKYGKSAWVNTDKYYGTKSTPLPKYGTIPKWFKDAIIWRMTRGYECEIFFGPSDQTTPRAAKQFLPPVFLGDFKALCDAIDMSWTGAWLCGQLKWPTQQAWKQFGKQIIP